VEGHGGKPRSKDLRNALAALFLRKNDREASEAQLKKVIELYPEDPPLLRPWAIFTGERETQAGLNRFTASLRERLRKARGKPDARQPLQRGWQARPGLKELEEALKTHPVSGRSCIRWSTCTCGREIP